jgi:hypothetical protein
MKADHKAANGERRKTSGYRYLKKCKIDETFDDQINTGEKIQKKISTGQEDS